MTHRGPFQPLIFCDSETVYWWACWGQGEVVVMAAVVLIYFLNVSNYCSEKLMTVQMSEKDLLWKAV